MRSLCLQVTVSSYLLDKTEVSIEGREYRAWLLPPSMKDRCARSNGSEGVQIFVEAALRGPSPRRLGNRVWRQRRRVAAGGGCTYEN